MVQFSVLQWIRPGVGLMVLGATTVMAQDQAVPLELGCPPMVVGDQTVVEGLSIALHTARAVHQPKLVRISQRPTEIHVRFGDEHDHRVLINSVTYPVKGDSTIFRTKIITDQPERLFVIGQYRDGGKTGPWTSYPHFFELDRTNGRWTDAGLAAVTVPDGSLQFPIELQKNEHREFLFVKAGQKPDDRNQEAADAELKKLQSAVSNLAEHNDQLDDSNTKLQAQLDSQADDLAALQQQLQNERKRNESLLTRGFLFSEPSRTIVGKMESLNGLVIGISRWIEMPVRLRLSNTVDAANFPLDGCRGELRFSLRSSAAAVDDAWTDLGIVTALRLTKTGGEIAAEFASGDCLADALQRTLTGRPSTVTRYELRASLRLIPDSGLLPEMSGETGNGVEFLLTP